MNGSLTKDTTPEASLRDASNSLALEESAPSPSEHVSRTSTVSCYHCGEPCHNEAFTTGKKAFCCHGCLVVHDLLAENGLGQFYDLIDYPGVKARSTTTSRQWEYLDDPSVAQGLVDFTDGVRSRITLRIPAIHCVACVWLLENLFRLNRAILRSEVNFPRKEVSIRFSAKEIRLSELVGLLTSIGYEPELRQGQTENGKAANQRKRQWLQVGMAGFAFGNIMLFSLPAYLGLDSLSGPLFKRVFGFLSLALALPVVIYSASDYWRAAWLSARRKALVLDVPIALGLAAIYLQSLYSIAWQHGDGYLDSLTGLIFFLLCGRIFQQKTQEQIAFDRDYKCFFPLSVIRKNDSEETTVALSQLRIGDRVLVRNRELIPADAQLVAGEALIDYSFVTGESEPVSKHIGDYLYAGGQQNGGAIEVDIVKAVSQSHLTSLWNHEAFQKDRDAAVVSQTDRYSRRFTWIVITVALAAGLWWLVAGNGARGIKAMTSVLIVACPCALALAAPFTLGTAQRLLARSQVFLRHCRVLESMAQVDTIVFDKTGTLTEASAQAVTFYSGDGIEEKESKNRTLDPLEESWVYALTGQSTHPHSMRIHELLKSDRSMEEVHAFEEMAGCGIKGTIQGHPVRLGSKAWLKASGVLVPEVALPPGHTTHHTTHLAIDGKFRGSFVIANKLRTDAGKLLAHLSERYELALLSGDHEKEREQFRDLFGAKAHLHFNQSPLDKLAFIRALQDSGKTVMMVGDGLNDAGALKQSDVGVAVVEEIGAFSPASDVILAARDVPTLYRLLQQARKAARIVRLSFGISAIYNAVGISIAAAGILSPIVCAILMPLSSFSVVLFACGATSRAMRRS